MPTVAVAPSSNLNQFVMDSRMLRQYMSGAKVASPAKKVFSSGYSSNFSIRGDEHTFQVMREKIGSFRDAFGVLGVPKILTMLTCIIWTTWLIVVAVAPNQTANWMMGTGAYDNGQFWMIIDKDPSITITGAVGLSLVDCCYIYVVVKTLQWRKRVDKVASFHQLHALSKMQQRPVASSGRCSLWLPPSSFEHQARVFADPSELALFRLNFDSLRINSWLDLGLRIGMNLSFCYRFKQIGDVLVTNQYRSQGTRTVLRSHQKPVPKAFATLFIMFSLAVWGFAYEAIANSKTKCASYPECVVYTYRRGISGMCPCQILIDVDRSPSTYEEWVYPVDVFGNVKDLATTGELRTLQIINRQLLEFPEELRGCQNLAFIELVYTSIQRLPSWTKEFKNLAFIHVEGKQGSQNLHQLPDDLFSDMPQLASIQFAVHTELKSFPALTGVPNLQSMTLAWLLSLRELPSLDRVSHLRRLIIAIVPQFETFPDLTPQQNLVEFVISQPSHICCNGFTGTCRLDDSSCATNPITYTTATCIDGDPFFGSKTTEAVFETFASTICQPLPPNFNPIASIPTKEAIEICENRPFGHCELSDGREGICYNARMQVLACLADHQPYIALRRYQIEKGFACNSTIEEWLGCTK